jgi:hypothetical protein
VDETAAQLLEMFEEAHAGEFSALGYGRPRAVEHILIHG